MYQSRLHFSNDKIAIAIDCVTGDILEINNLQTGENIIKNSCYMLKQPFLLYCSEEGSSDIVEVSHADFCHLNGEDTLKANISSFTNGNKDITVTVAYDKLIGTDEKIYDIPLSYTATLVYGKPKIIFGIAVKNQETGNVIEKIKFPCVNGIYLGEHYEDNTIVYPYFSGIKITNPVKVISSKPKTIYWKWQEYRYSYAIDNFTGAKQSNGLYSISYSYAGGLAMKWLDYYSDNGGMYFGSHDKSLDMVNLSMETFGEESPGMNFAFVKMPFLRTNDEFSFEDTHLELHEGDWHSGADIYREFKMPEYNKNVERPKWFEKSAGLIAHYDFKYQNGGVVHQYKDIPKLLSEAEDFGIRHLLISGWHKDGFDNGFPEYITDNDLGTEDDLKKSIKYVKDNGGHVNFYVNARLANTKYEHLNKFIDENVVIRTDSSKYVESYGNKNLLFGVMCANSKGWQDKLTGTASYITEEIGIDGIYLDQLGMAPPCICTNPNHNHKIDGWSHGYAKVLDAISSRRESLGEEPLGLIYEGVTDAYGHSVAGQLVSTFSHLHTGAFIELYKYTFPEQILVDMLYPMENLAMRPVHVAQESTRMINKAFVTGAYYWIYDLVDDNTFTRDEKQYNYLKNVIALRNFWLNEFGHGTFKDTVGIEKIGQNYEVKLFELDKGVLLAVSAESYDEDGYVSLPQVGSVPVIRYFMEDGVVTKDKICYNEISGKKFIQLPQKSISLLYIEKQKNKQA